MAQNADRQVLFKMAYKKMLEECFREKDKIDKIIYESENINTSVFSEEKENIGIDHNKKITRQMINEELDNIAEKSFNESFREIDLKNDESIHKKTKVSKSDKREIDEKDYEIFNTSITKEFWKDTKLDKREIELHDIVPLIKHNLKIAFKEYSRDALDKLKTLSKMIQQNRNITRRDIQSTDYIREILQSHIHEEKERYIKEFKKIETGLQQEIEHLKDNLKNKRTLAITVQKEKEDLTKKYEKVFGRFDETVK